MLTVMHLEPDDFLKITLSKQLEIAARMYVLDCHVAGLVYMANDDSFLYYLDRFFPTKEKQPVIDQINFYDMHKELYRLVNLDQRNRECHRY